MFILTSLLLQNLFVLSSLFLQLKECQHSRSLPSSKVSNNVRQSTALPLTCPGIHAKTGHVCVLCKSNRIKPLILCMHICHILCLRTNKTTTKKTVQKPSFVTAMERKMRGGFFYLPEKLFFLYSLITSKSLNIKGRVSNSCVGTLRKTI